MDEALNRGLMSIPDNVNVKGPEDPPEWGLCLHSAQSFKNIKTLLEHGSLINRSKTN